MSKVQVDKVVNLSDDGAPQLTYGAELPVGYGLTGAGGLNITGVVTAASAVFSGNVTIGGTLTYEDVTNIDVVGVSTFAGRMNVNSTIEANEGINVSAGVGTFAGNVKVGSACTITTGAVLSLQANSAPQIQLLDNNNGFAATQLLVENGGRDFKVTVPQDTIFVQGSTESSRIDDSGRLLIGTATARANFNAGDGSHIQLEGTTQNTSTISAVRNSNNDGPAHLVLAKTRNGSVGGNTVVQSGDNIGSLNFEANDGTNLIRAAEVLSQVDGTPGTNDMPGRLIFKTTADGAASASERLRIDAAGKFGVGTGSNIDERVHFEHDANITMLVETTATGSGANSALRLKSAESSSDWYVQTGHAASGGLRFYSGDEKLRIDSSGRLLIGTAANQHNSGDLLQLAAESSTASLGLNRFTANAHPSYINFFKSRNASLSGQTVVQDGDNLGQITWAGSDGTNRAYSAFIDARVDGTPGDGDMPGRLVFSTASDGSESPTERVRIDKNGQLVLSNGSMSTAYGNSICGGTNLELDTSGIIKFRTDTNQIASITDNGICFGTVSYTHLTLPTKA